MILRARSLPRGRRVGGVLVGLACISWGVGNVAWTWYELVARVSPPYPSLADPGYLLFQPLMAAAVSIGDFAGSTPQWLPVWRSRVAQIKINN